MDVYASEQEQVEHIRKWWKENWRSLLSGIALGLGGLYAFRAWQDYAKGNEEYGSVTFQNIITLIDQKKTDDADRLTKELRGRQPNSIYAIFAAFNTAKLAVDAKDYAKARQQLQWIVDHAPLAEIQGVAKTRLAKLFLEEGKADAAWTAVADLDKKETLASVQELKGDIQIAFGKPAEAEKFYRKAQTILGTGSGEAAGLQIKLDDLGTLDTKTAETKAPELKAEAAKAPESGDMSKKAGESK